MTISDAATAEFESTDWTQPGFARWDAPPFLTFASGRLTTRCEYVNPTASTVFAGDDPATSELCAGVGYYFPAAGPRVCHDGTLLP